MGGFSQTLTYSCAGLPSGASCTFAATSGTVETLTIQTSASSAQLHKAPFGRTSTLFYALLLPGFFGLVGSGGNRKRNLHAVRLLGLFVLLTVSTLGMLACAGVSSASQSNNLGTPAGQSSVTVTAATGGTNPLNHSVTITLIVQ
jgi:hypothetical protein